MNTFEHTQDPGDQLAERQRLLVEAFALGGMLYGLAEQLTGEDLDAATARDVGNILLPPRQPNAPYAPRYQLIENASEQLKQRATERQDDIYALAAGLGMRHDAAQTAADLAAIDVTRAAWVVEGGANKTSVVRRAVAAAAVREYYENPESVTLYQLGGSRVIAPSSSEYGVVSGIAPDYIATAADLTEFDVNIATARQAGYRIGLEEINGVDCMMGRKQGEPTVAFIQPETTENGLMDGFSALHQLGVIRDGTQLIIATNGQYRPKDELQAQQWAERQCMEVSAIALGDEPGFEVEHNGQKLTTGERVPTLYVNESVVLARVYGIA